MSSQIRRQRIRTSGRQSWAEARAKHISAGLDPGDQPQPRGSPGPPAATAPQAGTAGLSAAKPARPSPLRSLRPPEARGPLEARGSPPERGATAAGVQKLRHHRRGGAARSVWDPRRAMSPGTVVGSTRRNRESPGKKSGQASAAAAGEERLGDLRLGEATERLLAGMGACRAGIVAARVWTVKPERPRTASAREVEPRSGHPKWNLRIPVQKALQSEDPAQLWCRVNARAACIQATKDTPWSSRAGKGRGGQGLRERVTIPRQIQTRAPGGLGIDVSPRPRR